MFKKSITRNHNKTIRTLRQIIIMNKLLISCIALFLSLNAKSQLLIEDFDYPANDTVASVNPSKGWIIANGGNTNYLRAVSPGLTFTGFPRSGIGNSTTITTTGQDIAKNTSTSVTSGAIYAAFMMRVDTAKTTGDYFFAFLPQTSTSAFTGRLFIRSASSGFYPLVFLKEQLVRMKQ